MSTRACMGGWGCLRRDRCEHYNTTHRWLPAERLCSPGQFDQWLPLAVPAVGIRPHTPQPRHDEVTA